MPRTAAQWIADNPILADEIIGVEVDTGRMKVGDGATEWNDLYYVPILTALDFVQANDLAAPKGFYGSLHRYSTAQVTPGLGRRILYLRPQPRYGNTGQIVSVSCATGAYMTGTLVRMNNKLIEIDVYDFGGVKPPDGTVWEIVSNPIAYT